MTPTFREFFEAVWGVPPFPWQEALSERVAAEGWPGTLDLPTGAGKTAALDVALYHFAMDGGLTAPRRMILVVDRRVIVDQVGVRARTLRRALEKPLTAATAAVAGRLREIVGEGAPLLETAVLRGATLRDDAWVQRPHVPVLAASTVDQVGSRLLFRGYGVSDGMKPVHAGLVGCDTLLLLDEVHLARPFGDVLSQLERLRGSEGIVPRRFRVVQLSATPGSGAVASFQLGDRDRETELLARRLQAKKPATMEEVKVKVRGDEAEKRQAVAVAGARHARTLLSEGKRAVAVIVNRVDTARRAWALLEDSGFDRALLTGRMRPLDQHSALETVKDRIVAGRIDDPDARPLVLISTQCIEAGADFDFDGLVTECASLDALRQRFGRLDRLGERSARAVILGRTDLLGSTADVVYGEPLARTWTWLSTLLRDGAVDLGIDSLQVHLDALGDGVEDLRAPSREAPVMMPAYLDQWVQTSEPPQADPDVSLFLHGIPEDAMGALPDVQVVWRSDITASDLERARQDPKAMERLVEQLATTRPGALEALSLPVWTVKRWLEQGTAPAHDADDTRDDDVADIEGQREEQGSQGPVAADGALVLAWRGRRDSRVVKGRDVTAGSLLIVPAEVGGLGPHGTFDPEHLDASGVVTPVDDLGDAVQLIQRGRPSLRLDARVLSRFVGSAFAGLLPDPEDDAADAASMVRDALDDVLASAAEGSPAWFRAIQSALADSSRRPRLLRVVGPDGQSRWTALGRALTPERLRELLTDEVAMGQGSSADTTTQGDDGSFSGVQATLKEHLRGVGELAERFARAASLPPALCAALAWAGRIHDVGKADRRFQLWLYGGDEIAAAAGAVLAKSALPRQDVAARRRARERAGYPSGQRHELVSLDMAERSDGLRARVESEGADWDLVLHLVASHHGWCRPVAPAVTLADQDAEDVAWPVDDITLNGSTSHKRAGLGSGVTDRFWCLVRRYGWHELAYLEAMLRLADHRRSELEQEGAK